MGELKDYEVIGDVELSKEEDDYYTAMIEQAEKDIEKEVRVSFRWKEHQLNIIKKAAETIGVPYQTYIKTILFKQSLEDLKKVQEVLGK